MTTAALADAFAARRAEVHEAHQRFLQATQSPTNADIELLFAQTDRRFELLQGHVVTSARRMEEELNSRLMLLAQGVQQ